MMTFAPPPLPRFTTRRLPLRDGDNNNNNNSNARPPTVPTPRNMNHKVVADYTAKAFESSRIKVFVRARPPDEQLRAAEEDASSLFDVDGRRLVLHDPDSRSYGDHAFSFDGVFWTDAPQDDIFDSVLRPSIDAVLQGYPACCFAYGQTGSGKTYTMFGEDEDMMGAGRGLVPRALEALFESLATRGGRVDVSCSFLEMYCDVIRDLGRAAVESGVPKSLSAVNLSDKTSAIAQRVEKARGATFAMPGGASASWPTLSEDYATMRGLDIREDDAGRVFVKDLCRVRVSRARDAFDVLRRGLALRATHETKMNSVSSRSHTVFTVRVARTTPAGDRVCGELHLVDLAGCERLKKSESVGRRKREAVHINASLTALGKVIVALEPAAQAPHVPYRDSKLTRMLQDALGGSSFTALIATVHPLRLYADECLSTLHFAARCKHVRNQPRVQYVDAEDSAAKVKRLADELRVLRQRLSKFEAEREGSINYGGGGGGDDGEMLKMHAIKVLKAVGLEAKITSDGALLLADGRRLDFEGLKEDGDEQNDGVLVASWATSGTTLANLTSRALGALTKAPQVLRDYVQLLSRDRDEVRRKLRQRVDEVDAVRRDLGEHAKAAAENAAESRKVHERLLRRVDLLEAARQEDQKKFAANAQKTREALLKHNELLLAEQHHALARMPQERAARGVENAAQAEKHAVARRQEAASMEKWRLRAETAHAEEVRNLRRQYEHWLGEKDKVLRRFVSEFNEHRAKSSAHKRQLEKEMLVLHDALLQTQSAVRLCESGTLPVRVRNGVKRLTVPPSKRPKDPIQAGQLSTLPQTRMLLLRRRNERKERLRLRTHAEGALAALDDAGPHSVAEQTSDATDEMPKLAKTPVDAIKVVDDTAVDTPRWQLGVGRLVLEEMLRGSKPVEHLTVQEARETIGWLRHAIHRSEALEKAPAEWQPEAAEKELLRAIASFIRSDSVCKYVKELEEQDEQLRAELEEASRRYQELRLAYTFIGRKLEEPAPPFP